MSLTALQRNWAQASQQALLAVVLCALMTACTTASRSSSSQVEQNSGGQVISGEHLVQKGDTLYSIAFRYGWDWKTLAANNNIQAPYTIHPGQIIRLSTTSSQNKPVVAKNIPPVRSNDVNKSPPTNKSANKSSPPASAQTSVSSALPSDSRGWVWPTRGTLISRFVANSSLNKGIDIAGQLGEPVLAASNGTVVYAGSALGAYGELVIIKHSDAYVSAYGHNRRLLVREGQQVRVGQSIAEMGSTGTDRVKLHFEIRRQGNPVDPLQYLPKR